MKVHFSNSITPTIYLIFIRWMTLVKFVAKNTSVNQDFFFGAMFVSYALNVAWFVTGWVATLILLPNNENLLLIASIIIGFGLLMAPLTYRLSRLIWINFFVSYDPYISESKKAELKESKSEITK